MFIDATGAPTKLARHYGRARGERWRAAVPHGRRQTTTFIDALRLAGMTAPMIQVGAKRGAAFLAHVAQVLAPTLAPGDIVMMAICPPTSRSPSARRSNAPRPSWLPAALQRDFDPIETALSKFKA